MATLAAGATLRLAALGTGPVTARVAARHAMRWHGMPGLAWRLDLRLPDGTAVQALQVGAGPPQIADPRYAVMN